MFTNILTMGQVLPWIPSQSCMHMGTCAEGRIGARAEKAILCKIVDLLGTIKQATHDLLRALYFPYCLDWMLISALAWRTGLGGATIFPNFERKSRLFKGPWFGTH